MKQLELILNIKQTDCGLWELIAKPTNCNGNKLVSWFAGNTREEVFRRFCEAMSEPYIKYWFITEEKRLDK